MPEAAERMSRVDTAWLRMDTDANLMMIVGVWLLQPKVDYETLCARVTERLLKYRRFRQKVVDDAMGASVGARQALRHPPADRAREAQAAARPERAASAAGQRSACSRRHRWTRHARCGNSI